MLWGRFLRCLFIYSFPRVCSENGLQAWFIPWDADLGLDGIDALCLGAKRGGEETFIVALALTLF